MLLSYTPKSLSLSPSSLNLAPFEDQVLSISAITELLSTVQTFPVEGRISLPNHPQSFYLLAFSTCSHYVCPKTIKTVQCFNCNLRRVLVPRCHFDLDIKDATGTITATISEALGERLLSLTAEQIYESAAVQLGKPVFKFPDQKPSMLGLASFNEVESSVHATSPLPTTSTETGKKQRIKPPTPAKKN
ncbi:uncharacterized protein LOC107866143 [Capsicum annuum]|uniref:uncharacterized protein LOC107866143 n=1 Tax=Capsicum annuum TaxID=4072 RepID=UPI001FB18062|nr:uncharacterized protein LOC107866143 [Capsicum annuum]XP_047265356.1 uncharacterized protein LOC107866143 [Capsicum annuum]